VEGAAREVGCMSGRYGQVSEEEWTATFSLLSEVTKLLLSVTALTKKLTDICPNMPVVTKLSQVTVVGEEAQSRFGTPVSFRVGPLDVDRKHAASQ
jgi:hypothetical protein